MMLEKEISEQEIEVEKELSVIVDMDYNKAKNKPSINDVVLEGNKTLDDLGIAPKKDYIEKSTFDEKIQELNNKDNSLEEKIQETEGKIPDTKDFIKKDVNNLDNYTKTADLEKEYAKKTEIPNVENFITKEVEELDNFTNNTELEKKLKEKADTKDIPDVSNFITKEVNDLTNYTNNTDLEKNYTKKKDIEGVIKNLEDASYDYIHNTVKGYPITVENAGPYNVKNLKIYGNSEQNITETSPSPEEPSEIKTVEPIESEGNYLLKGKTTGKNLYNYEDVVLNEGATVDEDGWITITYDNSNGEKQKDVHYSTNNLPLIQDGTNYNIITEIKNITGDGALMPCSSYSRSGQIVYWFVHNFSELHNGDIIQLVRPSKVDDGGTSYINGLNTDVRFEAGQSGSVTFRISVLEDTTITSENFVYEPYKEKEFSIKMSNKEGQQYELAKINDIEDDLDFISGILNKKIKKYIITGNEPWNFYEKGNYFYNQTILSEYSRSENEAIPIDFISNMFKNFKVDSPNEVIEIDDKVMVLKQQTDRNAEVDIKMKQFNKDSNTFKQFLKDQYDAGTPVTIYYVLETPEQIQLQSTNIELFEGYNRITIEDKNGIVKEAEMTYLAPIKGQFATIDFVNNAISTAVTGALEEEY